MNKLTTTFFVLALLLMQPNFISAIENTGSIDVNVESMPSLEIKLSGPNVIRSGDTAFIKIKIFDSNSDENIVLNSIKVFDEEHKPIISEKSSFTFYGIKEEADRFQELREEIMPIANKDITKINPTLVNEMQNLYNQIKSKILIEHFNLNVNQFDSNLDGEINFLFSFEFVKNGEKEIVTQEFVVEKKPPLPSVATRHSPGWYAGDNHVHSEHSCFGWPISPHSDATIEENANASKQEGFDWIIITDHGHMIPSCSIVFGDWDDIRSDCNAEETSSFRCMRGEEIGWYSHILAYDSPDLTTRVESCDFPIGGDHDCWQQEIDDVTSQGGIAFIAHPYYGAADWTDWTITGHSGIEILNGAWNSNTNDATTINNPGGDDDSWREFLQSETNPDNGFVVGIGNSDTHDSNFGSPLAYSYCYMDSLSDSNIISALEDGNCIASNGPLVTFTLDGNIIGSVVNAMSGTNTLDISANSTGFGDMTYILIYVNEVLLPTPISVFDDSYSGSYDVELDTTDDYIRLEVYTDTGRRAFTNPIWVDVTSCSCGSWSEGSCGGGSCNSEQKQWTRSCTPSACAAESKCVYDEDCEEEEEGEGSGGSCTESGYFQCYEWTYEDCDVKIAGNWYENVPNNIGWGAVNDEWDPYVIGEYKIGWRGVDTQQVYYGIDDPYESCLDGESCQGGCDAEELVNTGTKTTVTAPGIAYTQRVLGYDDTNDYCCWAYLNDPFYPYYVNNPYIYVLNCFDDGDCSASKYCDKSSSWSNWDCVNDKSNGQSCIRDAQCSSGYCDNDGVGLSDDDHCFTPNSTYFDGQESTYCEYSTGSGTSNCDERQVGDDLNLCLGTSYYEEECSNTCSNADITSIFECSDAGCSCTEFLCDGQTSGDNITTCSSGQTYFADKCTSVATGEDRGDNICRNSSFVAGCTADSECNGIEAGTGNCNTSCNFMFTENITNCNQLQAMSNNLSGNYKLMNNIDCSATSTWNNNGTQYLGFDPVGDCGADLLCNEGGDDNQFTGNFDGQGYNITNLYINRGGLQFAGLFGATNNSNITNVGLINVNITARRKVGALVGDAWYSIISNSFSTGKIFSDERGGGLLGQLAYSTLKKSYSKADVLGSGIWVGGLVGTNFGVIINSYATGNATTTNNEGAGGLVGLNGDNENTYIYNSYSTGYAIGNAPGSYEIGGLVGLNHKDINNSFSTGGVIGTGDWVGGLIGRSVSGTITNSYWYNTTGDDGNKCVGYIQGGSVDSCTAKTDITYFQGDVYPNDLPMASWSFFDIWEERENDYPSLTWQDFGGSIDTTPPITTIASPTNDTTYNTNSVDLNWTVDESVNWCAYSLDDGVNNTDIDGPQNTTLTNLSEGKHNITIYCNDTLGNMGQSDYVYFTVDTSPQDPNKFYFKNSSGSNVAWFGDLGNVVIKGTLEQNSAYTATANDEFRFQDRNGNDVMIIDLTNGNMYLDGTLNENQNTLTPLENSDDFIVLNETNEVSAYINESGYMFLKGILVENGNP